jgi:cellulose synthase/poly-beta-1,6-N-acetylglucosamine synthase-like glycosyltransferase
MRYLEGWNETEIYPPSKETSSTSVSVIVAVYNEEDSIESCVQSILNCEYPKDLFEIIIVDNGSTDKTKYILDSFQDSRLTVLSQEEGNKKEALECGINFSSGDFLLFTDGDCTVRKEWINSMVYFHELRGGECILGPVEIKKYNNLLTRFQAFDMLAMMGITSGGLKKGISYLANGANFGYTKEVYNQMSGIPRKDLASGDDVFVLHEYIKSGGEKVYFQKSKDAIVSTAAQYTWKNLVQQRIRWASKATSYVQKKDVYINGFIFLLCLSILFNFLLIPFTNGLSFFAALFQLFIKATIDYAFIDNVNKLFKKKHLMRYFLSSFLVHYVYIIMTGVTSLLGLSYKWKGKRMH